MQKEEVEKALAAEEETSDWAAVAEMVDEVAVVAVVAEATAAKLEAA